MNIITEHAYQQARWGDAEFEQLLSGALTPGDAVDKHNAVLIKLQGDHDAEMERMRHLCADIQRDLRYARDGKEKADAKIRRMSETIRAQGVLLKKI